MHRFDEGFIEIQDAVEELYWEEFIIEGTAHDIKMFVGALRVIKKNYPYRWESMVTLLKKSNKEWQCILDKVDDKKYDAGFM